MNVLNVHVRPKVNTKATNIYNTFNLKGECLSEKTVDFTFW